MLRVRNIVRGFGAKKILDGVSFDLEESTIAGLIGPSGGGKSTLVKIIGHILRAQSGTIDYPVTSASDIGLMFQEGALFDSLNVFDNVAFPLVGGKVPSTKLSKDVLERVHFSVSHILGRVGLSKAALKMPGQLSGGMRRRVSLARAMVGKPKLLLLDDPTSGLDPVASSVIMNLIVEIHREYRPTLIMVSHDLRRLLPVVETIVALFDGKVSFCGTLDELGRCASPQIETFVSCRYDLRKAS